MGKSDIQMLINVECEDQKHQIDFFDLRARERLAVERQLEMPMPQVLGSQWLQSETVISFAAYLAVARERPTLSYESFLDMVDEEKVGKVTVNLDVARNYKKMTKHQLAELLIERGAEVPAKAKHAELVGLLEGDSDTRPT